MTGPGFFTVRERCGKTHARTGRIVTSRGEIDTPVFMPVGTQGSVKTLAPADLRTAGAQIILGNSYHLYLRPGTDIIRSAGGLQRFTGWHGPMLTDSGGFQVFSLKDFRRVDHGGVEFVSHIDGSRHRFTPASSMQIQRDIGADIVMCLDECPPYPCPPATAREAVETSARWAADCRAAFARSDDGSQHLFGIVQGSVDPVLRRESALRTMETGFPGYAVGGLSVGEPKDDLVAVLEVLNAILPVDRPRYLMGVGAPEDLWEAVERGIDMFDCVLPTRNARNGQALTSRGKVNIKNGVFRSDLGPLDPDCACPACREFSRAYINHLFHAREILALRLLSLHNIYFMIQLTKIIQNAIKNNDFLSQKKMFFERYRCAGPQGRDHQ